MIKILEFKISPKISFLPFLVKSLVIFVLSLSLSNSEKAMAGGDDDDLPFFPKKPSGRSKSAHHDEDDGDKSDSQGSSPHTFRDEDDQSHHSGDNSDDDEEDDDSQSEKSDDSDTEKGKHNPFRDEDQMSNSDDGDDHNDKEKDDDDSDGESEKEKGKGKKGKDDKEDLEDDDSDIDDILLTPKPVTPSSPNPDSTPDPDAESDKEPEVPQPKASCEKLYKDALKLVFSTYIQDRSNLAGLKLAKAYLHIKKQVGADEHQDQDQDHQDNGDESEVEDEKEYLKKSKADSKALSGKIKEVLQSINSSAKTLADASGDDDPEESLQELEDLFAFLLEKDASQLKNREEAINVWVSKHYGKDDGGMNSFRDGLNNILKSAKKDKEDDDDDEKEDSPLSTDPTSKSKHKEEYDPYQFTNSDLYILKNFLAHLPGKEAEMADVDKEKFVAGKPEGQGLLINILKSLRNQKGKIDFDKTAKDVAKLELSLEKKNIPIPQDDTGQDLINLKKYLHEKWLQTVNEQVLADQTLKHCQIPLPLPGSGPDGLNTCQQFNDLLSSLGFNESDNLSDLIEKITENILPLNSERRMSIQDFAKSDDSDSSDSDDSSTKKKDNPNAGGAPGTTGTTDSTTADTGAKTSPTDSTPVQSKKNDFPLWPLLFSQPQNFPNLPLPPIGPFGFGGMWPIML